MQTFLDGVALHALFSSGYRNLKKNMNAINDLNVFPVPDGDTGTNMVMTFGGGLQVADAEQTHAGKYMQSLSKGVLLSARGNSGVIFSQFVHGLYRGFAEMEQVTFGDFAEAFACAAIPTMPVSAFAKTDSTVLVMDHRKILTVCSNSCRFHNLLIKNLLQVVAQKNLALSSKIRLMSQKTTREKLLAYLLDQAKINGCTEFTIPLDRQALADYLGVERSAMSTELGKLKKQGIIDFKGSHFVFKQ